VGRPSFGVEPIPERAYVLAIDLRADRVIVALVGFGGDVLARREHLFRKGLRRHERIIARVADVAVALLDSAPPGALQVGVGVGVPGLVRQPDGLVRHAPFFGWEDVPLGDLLHTALGLSTPMVVGNDSDLGAIAERVRGSAQGAENVVYLAGQLGVGGGIVIDGTLLRGAQGYGGEVGHMRVNPGGRGCRCGAVGCWETEIGEAAIRRATGAADSEPIGDIVARARSGDRGAVEGIAQVGEWMAVGVTNLVHIFNPDVVVFGGSLRDVLPLASDQIHTMLVSALAAPGEHVVLALPALGDDSTLLGAAEAAFAPLLDDPVGVVAEATPALVGG
jgi:predicted NBD/HSP70 family sugar kinase